RAFELIPYFTGQPTMEGLLIESSMNAPYHFYMQAEVSRESSKAVQGIIYPELDFENGVRHLRLFNVRYFIAVTEDVKRFADISLDLKLLKKINEFSIYEVKSDGYVSIPRFYPLLVETEDWEKISWDWYKNPEMLDVPLVFGSEVNEHGRASFPLISNDLDGFKKVPIEVEVAIEEQVSNDAITFKTTGVGLAHWIKVTYFPNWKVEGALGPYFASPSLMIVIPQQENVRIYYGSTFTDTLGWVLTFLTFLSIVLSFNRRAKIIWDGKIEALLKPIKPRFKLIQNRFENLLRISRTKLIDKSSSRVSQLPVFKSKKRFANLLLLIIILKMLGSPLSIIPTIALGFFVTGKFVSYSYDNVTLGKFLLLTTSIFFTIISFGGFFLRFAGVKMVPVNMLYFLVVILIFQRIFLKDATSKIVLEKKELRLISLVFLISFFVYLWPALPYLNSPCTPGYDCSKHMEYAKGIYEKGEVILPVQEWSYYPFGTHINSAMLNKVFPFINNDKFLYLFMTFITALTIATLAGMLMDVTNNLVYFIVLGFLVFTSIYPASSLIQFGFWAQLFSTYYVITAGWITKDYLENPSPNMIALFIITSIGSILIYNMIVTLSIILMFLISTLIIKNQTKLKNSIIYLSGVGVFFGLYTLESFIRFIGSKTDLKINLEAIRLFLSIGSDQMLRGGEVLFPNVKYFGLLFILLSIIGLISSIGRANYLKVVFIAISLNTLSFFLGFKFNKISLYYYSKMMYVLIYPVLLFSVIGLRQLMSKFRVLTFKKKVYVTLSIIIIISSVIVDNGERSELVFGQKDFLTKTLDNTDYWPFLEFNRYERFASLTQHKEHQSYGFMGWLKGYEEND
ncbi:MAG: hypothetical protein ACXACY_21730, partial [Candidatus Hodarchaeales archaeon]